MTERNWSFKKILAEKKKQKFVAIKNKLNKKQHDIFFVRIELQKI